jgi:hypothetical protein
MIRLAVAFALVAAPAFAQPCHERDHIAAFLETRHGLALYSWGLSDAGDFGHPPSRTASCLTRR